MGVFVVNGYMNQRDMVWVFFIYIILFDEVV